jgi:hypothetical protein
VANELRVELALASHDDENVQSIERLEDILVEAMDGTDTDVCVFLEQASMDEDSAFRFERAVEMGLLPSAAYSLANADRLISQEFVDHFMYIYSLRVNWEERIARDFKDEISVNTLNTLLSLDRIFIKYRHDDGRPRLKLLSESSYGQIEDPISIDEVEESLRSILNEVESGEVDQAVLQTKTLCREWVRKIVERDRLVTEKIVDYISGNPDVTVLFISFGSIHTGIQHRLKKEGVPATRVFLDIEHGDSIYRYDPMDSVIRKVMLLGYDSVSELEWYRATVGFAMIEALKYMIELADDDTDEQSAIRMVNNAVRTFRNMSDFEEFQRKIKETSFYEALETIGQ